MQPYQKEKDFFACGQPVVVKLEGKETHIFSKDGQKLSTEDMTFGKVYGGGEGIELDSVDVTMESGVLQLICGGGKGDTVKNARLVLSGGVLRGRVVGGGFAKSVGDVNIVLDGTAAPEVITGSMAEGSTVYGNATVTRHKGNVLIIQCGGKGATLGDVTIEILGERIEKQIEDLGVSGKIKIFLPENIFIPSSFGRVFPMLPPNAEVTFTPPIEFDDIKIYPENEDEFFQSDAGLLELRMFELRDPTLKKQDTPFPEFIGDCMLLTAPSGENMLIDIGLDYCRDEVVCGLKKLGVEKLDYLVLTHFHSDHMGNAVAVLDNFKVKTVLIPDVNIPPEPKIEDQFNELMRRAESGEQALKKVAAGDCFKLGDVQLEVLNPVDRGTSEIGLNDSSIVLKVTYADNVLILTGDVTQKFELKLFEKYGDGLKCDFLKLAHHAIVNQNHYKFINACSPKLTAVHNLRESGIFMAVTGYLLQNVNGFDKNQLYCTGIHGAMKFSFDGTEDGIRIWTKYNAKGE